MEQENSETTFDQSQLFSPGFNRSVTLRSPSMIHSFRSNHVEHTSSPFRGSTTGVQHLTTGVQHSTTGFQHLTTGVQHSTTGFQHSTIGVQHSTTGFQHSTIGVQTPHEGVFSPKARNLNTEPRNLLQNDRPSTFDRPSTRMTQPCSPRMLELETGDDAVCTDLPRIHG